MIVGEFQAENVARRIKSTNLTTSVAKPKVFARRPNNYGYGNALGYAEEPGYGSRGLFFR